MTGIFFDKWRKKQHANDNLTLSCIWKKLGKRIRSNWMWIVPDNDFEGCGKLQASSVTSFIFVYRKLLSLVMFILLNSPQVLKPHNFSHALDRFSLSAIKLYFFRRLWLQINELKFVIQNSRRLINTLKKFLLFFRHEKVVSSPLSSQWTLDKLYIKSLDVSGISSKHKIELILPRVTSSSLSLYWII